MRPLVFVHGFLGGSQQWGAQVAALAGEIDVITVDLPGFGKNADTVALDSIAAIADWVLNELSARGVRRFHLLGHSMGGMIVQEMVALAPDRVDRLVLYGTGGIGVLPGRFETIGTSKQRAVAEGPRDTARRIAATWFLRGDKAAGFEGCAAIAEHASLDTILAGLDAMQGWRGAERLINIQSKTLIIWGDHDRTYAWAQTQQLWQSIAGSSLAVMPKCAHAAHLEKPELFNLLLRDFVSA